MIKVSFFVVLEKSSEIFVVSKKGLILVLFHLQIWCCALLWLFRSLYPASSGYREDSVRLWIDRSSFQRQLQILGRTAEFENCQGRAGQWAHFWRSCPSPPPSCRHNSEDRRNRPPQWRPGCWVKRFPAKADRPTWPWFEGCCRRRRCNIEGIGLQQTWGFAGLRWCRLLLQHRQCCCYWLGSWFV